MLINKTYKILSMLALIAVPAFFSSCEKEENGGGNNDNINANIAGADKTVEGLEIPHLHSQHQYICHKLSNGEVNYTMEYDRSLYHARWVAYKYDSKSAQRNWTTRTDAWAADPKIEKKYQVAAPQIFQGYNRGHIVGSAERYYSREANEQTFYMSNMSPMLGAFNSEYWGEIEDKARDLWGRNIIKQGSDFFGGTLYIVKGGSLQATTANPNPIMSYCTVRNGLGEEVKMAVPRYYFMACLFVSNTGAAKAIGFWLEHKNYNNTTDAFLTQLRRGAACSIDELEQKTGLDFFCNLKDNVEKAVESTYNISQWSGL